MSVPDAQSDFVRATLTGDGMRPLVGSLIEVGPRTIAVAFDQSGSLGLELGQRVVFALEGELVGGTHEAEGNVTGWREAEGLQICSLRYRDFNDYKTLLATQVGRTFNRRNSFRVRPGSSRPVTVTIQGEKDSGSGTATDVSSTGMGVVPERALDVASGEVVAVTLQMPDDPKPATLKARMCHIGGSADAPRYGMDFVLEDSRAFELTLERVIDYVMRRQREELRRDAQVVDSEDRLTVGDPARDTDV